MSFSHSLLQSVTMRGIYVFHYPKPNRPLIHKVGQAENIGRRKGDYATTNFEPEFSRVYEVHEGFNTFDIEQAIHKKLERLGAKVGTEWFEIELERIDECAIAVFSDTSSPFYGALKKFYFTDPTEIEYGDYEKKASKLASPISTTNAKHQSQLIGFTPREDQLLLLDKLEQHFIVGGNSRGQIRLPPGYGKTQIGCCIFPIQNGMKRILILVPSIKLAQETLNRVRTFHINNFNINYFHYFEVHSEGVTVSIDDINACEHVCVVGVYNSVAKLHEATEFDIIIFDEAHRTAIKSRHGADNDDEITETHFTLALSNNNVVAKLRLFMTATPRIISNDDNSMSNTDKYGDVIYSMTIRDAVKQNIINDYKIWMYVKTHEDDLNIETDGERFALLIKFLDQCTGNKTLVVCRSIKSCTFVASKLPQRTSGNVYSVHSKMNKHDVNQQITAFKSTNEKSCLCAVNMFKEGIDCPAIDSVVFYDERSSVIDVLQIVGRGLRHKPNVQFTDVGVLCSINPSQRLDEQSEMRYLRMIIQNMFDYNEEITNNLQVIKDDADQLQIVDEMITRVRTDMKDDEDTSHFESALTAHSHESNYGEQRFQQARDFAHERSARYNWRVQEDWFTYIDRVGLPRDIPRRPDRVYKNIGWISWDDFLGLDSDKPFDLSTYKYILKKELTNNNPTEHEYRDIVTKYGYKKIIPPAECMNIYKSSFYNIIESLWGVNGFMSLYEFRKAKATYVSKSRFTVIEYDEMKENGSFKGRLPHFPLVFYNVHSFTKL